MRRAELRRQWRAYNDEQRRVGGPTETSQAWSKTQVVGS